VEAETAVENLLPWRHLFENKTALPVCFRSVIERNIGLPCQLRRRLCPDANPQVRARPVADHEGSFHAPPRLQDNRFLARITQRNGSAAEIMNDADRVRVKLSSIFKLVKQIFRSKFIKRILCTQQTISRPTGDCQR
jgi:hypothetical protein